MENHEENEQTIKEVGSNLTGTAVPAKPGHQRDIPIDQYREDKADDASNPEAGVNPKVSTDNTTEGRTDQ